MTTARTLQYDVTIYFQHGIVRKMERARCVAEAIEKVRARVTHAYLAHAIVAVPREQ